MRTQLLFAALPLVWAAPALVRRPTASLSAVGGPLPHPVEARAPEPIALPQSTGTETTPITGLLTGLITGAEDIGSFSTAIPAVLHDLASVLTAASTVVDAIANGTIAGTDIPVVGQKLFSAVKPTATPTSIQDAINKAASPFSITNANSAPPTTQDLLGNVLGLVLNGFQSSDLLSLEQGISPFTTSWQNVNPVVPVGKTFYNTAKGNPKFSVSEAQLRAAIYIPSTFTFGKKQPVLLSPGTGATGSSTFSSNIGKLLAGESFADPVYLNIPQNLLNDAQINAEYVAYALQYLYAITSKRPAIVTWSQGALDAQWAFKYWTSLQTIVTDHIAISPDYHGTILAYLLCPGFASGNQIACTPAVIQQVYSSNFVQTLRNTNGDSAYVPTTTVYSGTDEIVQPQQGTAASGFLKDARSVGVSNTYLQGACALQPAGLLYTHEGVLYNPVAYALVTDALQNSGPGSFSRVSSSCVDIAAPGLSLADVVATEATIPEAFLNILSYLPKSNAEPAIKSYATY